VAPEIIAGRYVVLRAVGRGGMGTVWLCRDDLLGREVAVKQVGVLPGESVPDLARALREARSSAALNHPHVVSVFDAVEADDHIWLVMEYVPGETLSQLIAREGRLDPERVAAIGAQVADGLAAAHARGTVHRDVKPGNVLVAGDVAKISDFGIARTDGEDQLTRSGLLMGTPLYFSPELARGAEPSPAGDVWALGATLYAAVEGAPPVADRGNAIATLAAIADTRPPRPEHAGFLTDAIGRMLDPDPASRWSMADAAHALRRLHEQHRPPGTLEAPTAAVDRTSAVAAPAAPAAAPGTPQVGVAPSRNRRSRGPLLVGALVLLLLAGIGGTVLLDRRDDSPSAAGTSTGDQTPRPSRTPSTSAPSDTTSPTPKPSATATSPSTSSPPASSEPPPAGGDAGQTVADYYALLPGDPEQAWQMLGPRARAQAGGYDGYVGFWRSVDDVSVSDVSTDGDVVTAQLTYTTSRGQEDETRQLQVDQTDSGWLISEDLGPVSSSS
jgi:serine/threonine protein kinase